MISVVASGCQQPEDEMNIPNWQFLRELTTNVQDGIMKDETIERILKIADELEMTQQRNDAVKKTLRMMDKAEARAYEIIMGSRQNRRKPKGRKSLSELIGIK